jgi:hypothetical protein
MTQHQLTRTAALAMAIAALAAPSAIARSDVSSPTPPVAGEVQQDKRSPDATDAATPAPTTPQDKRSPDARDAAEGRGAWNSPEVVVVKLVDVAPARGFDWADAGIGAGALLGLILLVVGGALVVVHRRHPAPSRTSDGTRAPRSPGGLRTVGRWGRRAPGPGEARSDRHEVTKPHVGAATTERGRRRHGR